MDGKKKEMANVAEGINGEKRAHGIDRERQDMEL